MTFLTFGDGPDVAFINTVSHLLTASTMFQIASVFHARLKTQDLKSNSMSEKFGHLPKFTQKISGRLQ
jgi:hypothetical protein